jgi:hypothetical protein
MKTRWMGPLALALLPLALAACEGAPAAPELAASPSAQGATGSLREDEARFAVISFALVVPKLQPAPYSNRCPEGGGGTVKTIQEEPATGPNGETVYVRKRTVLETHGCRYRLMRLLNGRFGDPGAIITVTTEPGDWVQDRMDPDYRHALSLPVNVTTIRSAGTFRWSTDDGRAGTCAVDVTYRSTFDRITRKVVVAEKGTLCGQPLDFSRSGNYGDWT